MAVDESQKWVLMVTAQTPTNIAVIKYWGKRDEKLILPVNDSISVTLDPEHLCTTTTVSVSPAFTQDRMWLNGEVKTFFPFSTFTSAVISTLYISHPVGFQINLACLFRIIIFFF